MRLSAILAPLLLLGSLAPAPVLAQQSASAALATLAEDYWQWRLREFPEGATRIGDMRYNDRLTDISEAAIAKRQADTRQFLERARAIAASSLEVPELLSLELLRSRLEVSVDGQRFPTEVMILEQLDGPQLAFPQLVAAQPFRNAADYGAYIARLNAYPRYLQQLTALLERGIRTGWVQPAGPLRTVPDQIAGQLTADVTESPFYKPFANFPAEISAAEQERLRAAGRVAIVQRVNPALTALREFVRTRYLPAGERRAIGASSLPDGRDYYAYEIRANTSTTLSADSIHRLGLSEVARIRASMDSVVRQVGFTGTFAEFLHFLRTDPRFYYTEPEALLMAYRDAAKRADGQLPRLFAELPRNSYGVEPFPDFEAPSQTTARYSSGAQDGTRAGRFMVNLYRLDTRPKYEIEALTLHEAVPGHHLQIARAQELRDLPNFRRSGGHTAFVEGWALYAESLGPAMGFYADPYSKFGQLTYEMWRACRLVVDTGIHQLGWTRQQAIDFMMENSAKSEHDITVEVDRYIVWPGQALAYKLGELRIKELRARAERTLGERFDLRRFHNAVLDNGALPLDVLEQQIDRWIAGERTRAN